MPASWHDLIGLPGQLSGTSGTAVVPIGAVIIEITAHASAGGASFSLFGGPSVPVINGTAPLQIQFNHALFQANSSNGGLVSFVGTDHYWIHYVIQASLALSTFDPSRLRGIAHWYRSDLGVTLNAGNVQQWSDQIGTSHLVQATLAKQPTYNVADAAYNNQPTIQSTGTTQFLANNNVTTLQPVTIWLVGEFSTTSGFIVALGSGGSPPTIFRSGTTIVANAGVGKTISSGVASAAKHATLATYNSTSGFIGADNWLTGGVSGDVGTGVGASIGAFAFSAGANGTVGKIAELIIQSGTPTLTEKASMAVYLLARYGIAVT